MNLAKSPCYGCNFRNGNGMCHASCEAYKTWAAERMKAREALRKEREACAPRNTYRKGERR